PLPPGPMLRVFLRPGGRVNHHYEPDHVTERASQVAAQMTMSPASTKNASQRARPTSRPKPLMRRARLVRARSEWNAVLTDSAKTYGTGVRWPDELALGGTWHTSRSSSQTSAPYSAE